MSTPHKALSALVCVMVAFMLGIVARLPALAERLEAPVHEATYQIRVPAHGAWQPAGAPPGR